MERTSDRCFDPRRRGTATRLLVVLVAASAAPVARPVASDCNENGVDDSRDLAEAIRFDAPMLLPIVDAADRTLDLPTSVVATDLDEDGDDDLVVLRGSAGRLTLLECLPGGRFGPPISQDYRVPLGLALDDSHSVAVGDFDGDDDLDFAVPNPGYHTVSILWVRAPFVFDSPQDIVVAQRPAALVATDLDSDGKVDLAVACERSADVAIFERDARGTLSFSTRIDVGGAPREIASGDVDGDGLEDLVVIDATANEIVVLWNTNITRGAISFAAPVRLVGLDHPLSLILADFDRDGRLDIAVASSPGSNISLFRGPAAREFAPAVHFHGGDGPIAIAALDFDADGAIDLAVANRVDTSMTLLHNRGNGAFDSAHAVPGIRSARRLAAGDFDRDGLPDLVATTTDPASVLLLRNRSESLPTLRASILTDRVRSFVATDIDGDRDVDLVVVREPGNIVEVLCSRGPGAFESVFTFATAGPVSRVFAVDLDSDHAPELLIDEVGRILIVRRDDTGRFTSPVVELSVSGTVIGVEDFDGDGWRDLLDRDARSMVAFYPSDRRGGFQADARVDLFSTSVLGLGDLDGDGAIDILEGAPGTTSLRSWFHGDDGRFEARWTTTLAVPRESAALADLDGDGRLDLVLPELRAILVLLNTGDGSFELPARRFPTEPATPNPVAVLDIDLDGRLDIVSREGERLRILRDTGPLEFETAVRIILVANALDFSDFDLDGDVDILALTDGVLRLIRNETRRPASRDDNHNGVPDECEGRPFHRGDVNDDGRVDLADAVRVLTYLFTGGAAPGCREAADANNDGVVRLDDAVLLLDWLFRRGAAPAIPGPPPRPCAPDPDPSGGGGDLGCLDYDRC